MIGTVELFLLRCRQELSWWERTKMVKGFMNYVNRWDLQEKIDIAIHVMFRDRTCSTESELRMSKIWSDLCIFIGSYPWSTAEQKHRLRHHHHSISLCILKKIPWCYVQQKIRGYVKLKWVRTSVTYSAGSCRPLFFTPTWSLFVLKNMFYLFFSLSAQH